MISAADYAEIVTAARQALALDDAPGKAFGRLSDIVTRGRVALLKKLLLAKGGAVVRGGPFAGMAFHARASEGCYLPKLLGCYEAELHGPIAALPARGYRRVVDIGCAEGYYAVGLARLLPDADILAFDIDANARAMTLALARANGVAERVGIAARADHAALDAAIVAPTLVFCDCEGCEYELLDPRRVPALARADLIVELHDVAAAPERLRHWLDAFRPTHEIEIVEQGPRNPGSIGAIAHWKHLDQLLALWEFRAGPTPWAWLRAKPAIQSEN